MRSPRRNAYSLLELLGTITILGVLAGLVIPRVYVNKAITNKNACQVHQGHIEVQVQLWKRQYGSWPANNLSNMLPTSSPAQYDYFPDGLPVCPVDGTAYTIDPTTHEVIGHTH